MLLVIEAFGSFEILNIKAAVPSIPLLVAMYSAIGGFLSIIIFGRRKTACVFVSVALLAFALGAVQPDSYVKVFNDGDNVVHIKSSKGKDIICTSGYDNIESYVNKMNIECIDALVLTKLPSNYDFKNINIKKIYAPKYDDKKISGNFSVKYYDTDVIIIDGVKITPVSFAPYRSKVDEKRPVLHINNGKKSILFEPYANYELNERYLSQLDADIVVLKHGASIKKPYEVVVGSGLQQTENMLYYDIEKCGSIIFYDDKTKTLR